MPGDGFPLSSRNAKGRTMVSQDMLRRADAEEIAITALGFIAGHPALLPRFLAVTGIQASDIRAAAMEPGFLAGVLNFLLAHEPSLIEFAEAAQVKPARVAQALRLLPAGDDAFDRST